MAKHFHPKNYLGQPLQLALFDHLLATCLSPPQLFTWNTCDVIKMAEGQSCWNEYYVCCSLVLFWLYRKHSVRVNSSEMLYILWHLDSAMALESSSIIMESGKCRPSIAHLFIVQVGLTCLDWITGSDWIQVHESECSSACTGESTHLLNLLGHAQVMGICLS